MLTHMHCRSHRCTFSFTTSQSSLFKRCQWVWASSQNKLAKPSIIIVSKNGRTFAFAKFESAKHIFFYKHRVYKHIRLRFTEILSTLLSTLQPEIWLESNFTRKFFRRGLIFTQILIFLSYFYQKLYIKYFVLFIFYKYAF